MKTLVAVYFGQNVIPFSNEVSNEEPNSRDIWLPFLQTYRLHRKYYGPKQ